MADLTGKILKNRYKVIESLGRGGMAEVYKVWDEKRASFLAMKVLRQDIAHDPIFLRRFQREAQSLSKLDHPNIVRYYGLERDDLTAFLLMEYVDGVSLQAEILRANGKPLALQRIRDIMQAVCAALHYAHGEGLVHCDIKPGNILIDKSSRILLTDFGIARTLDSAISTMVGIGTPAYMAPELIRGKDPTPRSDIYSLGIVLYEMLTGGERPFTGERATITGSTAEKVRWEQVNLVPQSAKRHNPELDEYLDAVITCCLQKDPTKRFQSVQEFHISLNDFYSYKKKIEPQIPSVPKARPSLPNKQRMPSPAWIWGTLVATIMFLYSTINVFPALEARYTGISKDISTSNATQPSPIKNQQLKPTEDFAMVQDATDLTFAVCVKSISANWFRRMEEGLIEFSDKTGAKTFLCGPSRGDPAGQIGIINEIIAQGVDGIANVPFGVEEHDPIHKKALDSGIPVILHEAPLARYATYDVEAFDNCEYGEEMMRELAVRMNEKGTYVSFVGSVTNETHMIWQECAYQYQLANYPEMRRLGLYDSKEDIEIAYQTFKDLLSLDMDITGMTGSSAGDVVAVGQAVQEAGLTNRISVVGTSIASYAGDLIATGDIDLAMAWDPKMAGKAMCEVLLRVLKGEEIQNGDDLGVPGYENVVVSRNSYGIPIVTGRAWIKIDRITMPQYSF